MRTITSESVREATDHANNFLLDYFESNPSHAGALEALAQHLGFTPESIDNIDNGFTPLGDVVLEAVERAAFMRGLTWAHLNGIAAEEDESSGGVE